MKTIPQTTVEACAKYATTRWSCECPDYTTRGGSYFHGGNVDHHVCKHISAVITGKIHPDEIKALREGTTVEKIRAARAARYAKHDEFASQLTKTQYDYIEWA